MAYQAVFKRKEMKYLMSSEQYEKLMEILSDKIIPDDFPTSAISNLYYDTPDFRLIRTSLHKPKYKEKLRLRCYNVPNATTQAFLEIKKKALGIVYKRRESLPYQRAIDFLAGKDPGKDTQIFRELDWMLKSYKNLAPAMFLSYDRLSYKGVEDSSVRITFDQNILWRTTALDLSAGTWGEQLLEPGQKLMEIKISNAMPLWLAHALSECKIYPTSFSKYGKAYQAMISRGEHVIENQNTDSGYQKVA